VAYSTVSATTTMSFYMVYAAEKKPVETRTSSFYFTCRIQMRQCSLAPTLLSWKRTTLFARIMTARPPGRSGLRCFNNSIFRSLTNDCFLAIELRSGRSSRIPRQTL
jgi:hypothetical protein